MCERYCNPGRPRPPRLAPPRPAGKRRVFIGFGGRSARTHTHYETARRYHISTRTFLSRSKVAGRAYGRRAAIAPPYCADAARNAQVSSINSSPLGRQSARAGQGTAHCLRRRGAKPHAGRPGDGSTTQRLGRRGASRPVIVAYCLRTSPDDDAGAASEPPCLALAKPEHSQTDPGPLRKKSQNPSIHFRSQNIKPPAPNRFFPSSCVRPASWARAIIGDGCAVPTLRGKPG